MKRADLYRIARLELAAWRPSVNRGLVMAILWAFIHRITTGESIEETFAEPMPDPEYHI